jgi:hypothetical protein
LGKEGRAIRLRNAAVGELTEERGRDAGAARCALFTGQGATQWRESIRSELRRSSRTRCAIKKRDTQARKGRQGRRGEELQASHCHRPLQGAKAGPEGRQTKKRRNKLARRSNANGVRDQSGVDLSALATEAGGRSSSHKVVSGTSKPHEPSLNPGLKPCIRRPVERILPKLRSAPVRARFMQQHLQPCAVFRGLTRCTAYGWKFERPPLMPPRWTNKSAGQTGDDFERSIGCLPCPIEGVSSGESLPDK